MEGGRESMINCRVTMAGSDASSDYHVTGSAQPAVATQSGAGVGVSPAPAVTFQKKKRGRPRSDGPNGSVATPISVKPISSAAPSQVIDFSSKKKRWVSHYGVSAQS